MAAPADASSHDDETPPTATPPSTRPPPGPSRTGSTPTATQIEDHDRGLLYDLGTMNRRRALGLLGGVGALAALAACGTGTGSAATGASSSSRPRRRSDLEWRPSTTTADASGTLTEVDGRDRRSLPRRRVQRRQRPRRLGRRPLRHPVQLRLVDDDRGGRPAHHHADRPRHLDRRRPDRCRRLPLALRPGGAGTRSTPTASPARTTCAASRRPTPPGPSPSRRSSPRATRDAGRTSTSRSTPASPTPPRPGRSSRPRRSRCPRRPARRCTRPTATPRASRNLSSVSLARDNVFGNDGGIHQIATMSGDTSAGYTAALTIGV